MSFLVLGNCCWEVFILGTVEIVGVLGVGSGFGLVVGLGYGGKFIFFYRLKVVVRLVGS